MNFRQMLYKIGIENQVECCLLLLIWSGCGSGTGEYGIESRSNMGIVLTGLVDLEASIVASVSHRVGLNCTRLTEAMIQPYVTEDAYLSL